MGAFAIFLGVIIFFAVDGLSERYSRKKYQKMLKEWKDEETPNAH